MNRVSTGLLSLAVTVLVMACATGQYGAAPTLAVTGESMAAIGDQFVAFSKVYDVQCKPDVKIMQLAKFCQSFAEYGPEFQKAFPPALATWKAAVSANNTAATAGAQATLLELSGKLAKIGLETALIFVK